MLKKSFMIKFYIPHSDNIYTFQNAKYYFETVAKTCEKVVRLNMTSTTSESRRTKQLLASISVNMRIYLPLRPR